MYSELDFEIEQEVRSRIEVTKKHYADRDIPEYTLWKVLTRFDKALGMKKGVSYSKSKRYLIMKWMFPGKWGAIEEVTGNDLTPLEVHVMAKWSDDSREAQFHEEIKAVYRVLSAEIDTPEADAHIAELIEQPRYPMRCGHMSDQVTKHGHPFCSACEADAQTDLEMSDAFTIDRLKLKEGI